MDKSIPVVSVVMAAYNVFPRDFHRAITSILSQTYKDFEIIIVDDASTDDTLDIAKAYARKDGRVVVVKNDNNLGAAGARNKGIQRAVGKYIAIMDADDIAHPKRLAKQVAFLENNPKVGLLGTAYRTIDGSGRTIQRISPLKTDKLIRWEMLLNSPFAHSSVTYRRELYLQTGGYPEDHLLSEDYELFYRMSAITKMANLKEALVYYRISPGGLSRTQNEIQFDWASRVSHQAIAQLMGAEFIGLEETKALRSYLNTGKEVKHKDALVEKYFAMFAHFSDVYEVTRQEKQLLRRHIHAGLLWNWWNSAHKYSASGRRDFYRSWRAAPSALTYRLIRFAGGGLRRKVRNKGGRKDGG